ncbi:MAG: hypothetical protein GY822_31960 [Deltaproteobacteria bacterium]|nr:hypothetical protein [Deltaproteobacteria bacterium]
MPEKPVRHDVSFDEEGNSEANAGAKGWSQMLAHPPLRVAIRRSFYS